MQIKCSVKVRPVSFGDCPLPVVAWQSTAGRHSIPSRLMPLDVSRDCDVQERREDNIPINPADVNLTY